MSCFSMFKFGDRDRERDRERQANCIPGNKFTMTNMKS